ncbi:MAG: S-methyl-5'-thioadenosine phosphorylase [Acidobacteria bacterium]|nr:S-methyl-5'-thioadenosine phosphorylase [Planctomycetota bacterium]MBE3133701.1 S-methyl-5'-thioadenosine phosphorylase [Acidobacteriota bacterium]
MGDVLVGLIGGTGLGEALTKEACGKKVEVRTPFGKPSAPILLAEVAGQRAAILARHGWAHQFNPSQVPYRANIWALKKLGVTHILASGATGILRESIAPRDLVLCDQVIDKTFRPGRTFFEDFVAHIEFAHPFCESLRRLLVECGKGMSATVHPEGTYVCMEGPQFSTRAESLMHREWGGDLIGMTSMPEAKLAREAEICYALIAIPTDYDCWREHEPGTSPDAVLESILANMAAGTANAVELIKRAVPKVAAAALPDCPCRSALAKAIWTDRKAIRKTAIRKLAPLVGKYLGAKR